VFDESDEAGDRFVQAFMSLSIGGTIRTTRAEGAGPVDALTRAMRHELEKWYPALQQMRLGRFSVTAIDVSAHDSAAHVRVTVSFHADGHEPWITAGVSSDLNQAALMAIVDGFHYWLLTTRDVAVGVEELGRLERARGQPALSVVEGCHRSPQTNEGFSSCGKTENQG
jgi:2-isopropylmalate synthase